MCRGAFVGLSGAFTYRVQVGGWTHHTVLKLLSCFHCFLSVLASWPLFISLAGGLCPSRTIQFRMSGNALGMGVSVEEQHSWMCGLLPLALTCAQAVPAPSLSKIKDLCQLSTVYCTSRKILHKGETSKIVKYYLKPWSGYERSCVYKHSLVHLLACLPLLSEKKKKNKNNRFYLYSESLKSTLMIVGLFRK